MIQPEPPPALLGRDPELLREKPEGIVPEIIIQFLVDAPKATMQALDGDLELPAHGQDEPVRLRVVIRPHSRDAPGTGRGTAAARAPRSLIDVPLGILVRPTLGNAQG